MYQRYIKRKPLPSEINEQPELKINRIENLKLHKNIHWFTPKLAPFTQILKTFIDIVDPINFEIFED